MNANVVATAIVEFELVVSRQQHEPERLRRRAAQLEPELPVANRLWFALAVMPIFVQLVLEHHEELRAIDCDIDAPIEIVGLLSRYRASRWWGISGGSPLL